MLAAAQVMGGELTPDAVQLFVEHLLDLSDEQIIHALRRTVREVRGTKLTLQDVLSRAGVVSEAEALELDALAAWDRAVEVADGFCWYNSEGEAILRAKKSPPSDHCRDCRGTGFAFFWDEKKKAQFVKTCTRCVHIDPVPEIDLRLADSVRRIGGWGMIKGMTEANYPFVRRDFLAEYQRWRLVERYPAPAGQGGDALLTVGDEMGGNTEEYLARILATPEKKPAMAIR